MAVQQILTHPGGAHKDDFLACSVLAHIHQVGIVRCEPTPEDLENPMIAVVDVGGEHEPSRMNFDHHQFPRDQKPTCALSLVLQHLGLYEDALNFCDWMEPAEWFDCRGPNKTAEWLGVDRSVMNKLNSPIDVTVLRRFALTTEHRIGEPLWTVMEWIGSDLVAFLKTLRDRLNFIEKSSQMWELEGERGPVKVLFLPRTDPLPSEPSMGLFRYLEQKGWEKEMMVLVYPDRRGEGYALSRFDDHPAIDFSSLDACDDVHFAHGSGFIAKTSATSEDRLKELILLGHCG